MSSVSAALDSAFARQTPARSPPRPSGGVQQQQSSSRGCGFCKQSGHVRSTCPAFRSSEMNCMCTVKNDSGTYLRSVGNGDGTCECWSCVNYRKYNSPTPVIACQIIKDQKVAKALEEQQNQFPSLTIKNETRMPIYVNSLIIRVWFERSIEAQDSYTIKYGLIDKTDICDYIITDHQYDGGITLSDIEPQHILKLVTIEYGTKGTVTITTKESSEEDQWKEAALKSYYLLNQLRRLGANDNPNYEPILDMVQDIEFPEHTEQDKERAGVTSEFTNVHETTGVYE
jgi:hypothetical protein